MFSYRYIRQKSLHLFTVTILLAQLGACTAHGQPVPDGTGSPPPLEGTAITVGDSAFGNFLAGRFAYRRTDIPAAAHYYDTARQRNGGGKDLQRDTYTLMAMQGKIETAAKLARPLTKDGRGELLAEIIVMMQEVKTGDLASAEARLKGLRVSGSGKVAVPLLSAWLAVSQGDLARARTLLDKLAHEKGSEVLADLHSALIDEVAGDNVSALERFARIAGSTSGRSLRVGDLLGGYLKRLGLDDDADRIYASYLEGRVVDDELQGLADRASDIPSTGGLNLAQGMAEALFDVASSLRQLNATDGPVALLQLSLYLNPEQGFARILLADIFESRERFSYANQIYRQIPSDSPFSWSAKLRQANNLIALERYDDAADLLEAMAAEKPTSAEPLIVLGNAYRVREKFELAIDAYNRAVERFPDGTTTDWTFYYHRGISYERTNDWPAAEADFLRALKIRPDQPYVLNYLGYTWVEMKMHLDKARKMLEMAVSARPNDGYIVDSLGWVLYRLGDYPGAITNLEKAVELRPQDPVLNDHLGDAYWRSGRSREAVFQWRRALSLKPEEDEIPTIQDKIKSGLPDAPTTEP